MPNGHYDEEAGICWQDRYDHSQYKPENYPIKEFVLGPEMCHDHLMSYDNDCLNAVYLIKAVEWLVKDAHNYIYY